MKQKQEKESAASKIGRELQADEHYRKAIALGIANLSAIADKLAVKVGCSKEAAKVAVARWARENERGSVSSLSSINSVLSKSSVSLQDDVVVTVVENNSVTRKALSLLEDVDLWSMVFSPKSITLVCAGAHSASLHRVLKGQIILTTPSLCLVRISSPDEIEGVSGVYGYVLDCIARKGINILETSSCYTDTNIIVQRKNAVACFQAVQEACGKA